MYSQMMILFLQLNGLSPLYLIALIQTIVYQNIQRPNRPLVGQTNNRSSNVCVQSTTARLPFPRSENELTYSLMGQIVLNLGFSEKKAAF